MYHSKAQTDPKNTYIISYDRIHITHSLQTKMSIDKIFDLTAGGVHFIFHNVFSHTQRIVMLREKHSPATSCTLYIY